MRKTDKRIFINSKEDKSETKAKPRKKMEIIKIIILIIVFGLMFSFGYVMLEHQRLNEELFNSNMELINLRLEQNKLLIEDVLLEINQTCIEKKTLMS